MFINSNSLLFTPPNPDDDAALDVVVAAAANNVKPFVIENILTPLILIIFWLIVVNCNIKQNSYLSIIHSFFMLGKY